MLYLRAFRPFEGSVTPTCGYTLTDGQKGYFAEWSGGFFRRVFLKGTKVGIAGQNKHTSTYNSTGRVKKGNTTQLYGEGDPEGRFCRSPGYRMEEECQGGPSPLYREGRGQHEAYVGIVGRG